MCDCCTHTDPLGSRLRTLIQNDLAVIDAMEGKLEEASKVWQAILTGDRSCLPARLNFRLVEAELAWTRAAMTPVTTEGGFVPAESEVTGLPIVQGTPDARAEDPVLNNGESLRVFSGALCVAVISLLFNWPSTGGGNMHTAGLVEFLGRDGYDVRHFYARYPGWGIGRVPDNGLVASDGIEFTDGEWNVPTIRHCFCAAVDSFRPDYAVISDTWNMKPHLADCMRGYPTILLMQAQECLCPLNNLRLLGIGPVKAEQCPRNQLATPQVCHQCLGKRGHHSGALHQVERALAEVGTAEYDRILRQSFYEAEAVLVLNPITAAMFEPFSKRVCIVPWGIDPARFPWPADEGEEKTLAEASAIRMRAIATSSEDTGEASATQNELAEAVSTAFEDTGEASATRDEKPEPVSAALGDTCEASATQNGSAKRILTLFTAAVAGEVIKGFHVAHEACRILAGNAE